jgi:DNA polymerase-4
MEIPIEKQLNHNEPHLMHVDLNSCFATIEQQAHHLIRGIPVAIVPFMSRGACIIAPSIEAKKLGIKTGFSLRDAKVICPDIIAKVADPRKYRDVHMKYKKIFLDYSPNVYAKSIDEVVVDFSGTRGLYKQKTLVQIAKEIKQRMREDIGEWISCSAGISTNQFLAKLAASLKKPDGLEVITHENLLDVYKRCKLTDLNGIADKYQARLNVRGIFTPMDFLYATDELLKKQVFKSKVGGYWYLKLRGFESDPFEFAKSQFGRQYALQRPTSDRKSLAAKLMKLCEGAGRKMRRAGYAAYGAHIGLIFRDGTYDHKGKKFHTEMVSLMELFQNAIYVMNTLLDRNPEKVVGLLSVSFFDVIPSNRSQLSLFEFGDERHKKIARAMDQINDRWGEYTIFPSLMMGLDDEVVDRIPFGGASFIEDLYA